MHFFPPSLRPHPQEPQQAVPDRAAAVDMSKPKSSRRVRELFGFGRSRSQKPRPADSNAIVTSSSSRSSLEPGIPRQDGPISTAHDSPSNSASRFSHSSQPTASPRALDALGPPSPVTPPSIHRVSPSPTADSDPGQTPVVLQASSVTASQLSLISRGSTIPPSQHSLQPQDGSSNTYPLPAGQNIQNIHESRNVFVDGTNNYVNYMTTSSNKFMEKLLDKTIQGAAFDSSDRDPPPRCHPGTRLAVIARCLEFIASAAGQKKVRWVVGAAGVGKSAIMQNVAESPLASVSECASIFLSINGRNDGAKIILTLVYQLAAQCEPYRQFVEREITRHPALLRSSMSVQFKKFLVEPLIDTRLSDSVGRILIIIDGLDECDKPEAQRELLRLITDMCSTHPSSPIVWIIASRPEHHITSFFAQHNVQTVYEKEAIEVDSDEARSDVERFLRAELQRIQEEFSLSPRSQWPREQDFWKLANASGGLFVYAQTVTKYIGSLAIADPVSQLDDVLKVIDAHPLSDVPREQHPLVLLDALYARILSKVPQRIMANTRKILLALVLDLGSDPDYQQGGFLVLCNRLGMTCDDAYAAIRHLGSVLDAPTRDEAHEKMLRPFHKSFIDYVSDFTRSGFSSDIEHEARQLDAQYTIRILGQAPGGIDHADTSPFFFLSSGYAWARVAWVPGAGSDIVLTWSADEDSSWNDKKTRVEVYKWACSNVVEGIRTGKSVLCTAFYIRTVTTQSMDYDLSYFPWEELVNLVFEKSRRHEFMKSGLLTRVPVKQLDFTRMTSQTKLRFRCPSGTTITLSDLWNPSCEHIRTGDWGEGKDEDWTTTFDMDTSVCHFCCQRLKQHVENWKIRSPDHNVTLLLTSAEVSFVEFQFIDPEDGVSEWTYWITLEIPEEERRKPGRIV